MSIRIPTQVVLDKTFSASAPGADSVAGVVAQQFLLPQDTDNVLMKWYQASVSGSGTVSLLFQTSDDGGTTWYDVARTNTYTSANGATSILNGTAEWMSIPVVNLGANSRFTTSLFATGSLMSVPVGTIGKAAASTLSAGQYSGLPIMGISNRVCLVYTGAITTNEGVKVKVLANSQASANG